MKLKLKVLPVEKYKNYFIDLNTVNNNLGIDWDSNCEFVRIWNCKEPPLDMIVCHVDNVDNLIEALKLIKGKFKK